MEISFHGADRGVTGSCHMLECDGKRILVDCGLYQGGREIEEENLADFGFDPASLDFLLLTHAHLDHCGRIPLLAKRGFRGEIITTAASRELARLVMLDSANLQEEEARYQRRHKARRGQRPETEPLYSVLDALNSTDLFGRTAHYNQLLQLTPSIGVTFLDAGHILGSASVLVDIKEGERRCSVLFSGDLGNSGRPLLRDPVTPKHADVVVMETTYGDRRHKALEPSVDELYDAINGTFKRGGNVIIPTFALERAQELLFYLREGVANDRLPGSLQVFLDSPMAISATEIYGRYPECYEPSVAKLFHDGDDPFALRGLHFTRETAESIALNRISGGAVILAGSGMCTGGRVRHHLKQNLWRRESGIVFVGFAARGTLARQIIDGAREVKIFGEPTPVRASIHTINGFSAHADQPELLAWHRKIGPKRTFLVHGEEDTMRKFATLLRDTEVELPELGQRFAL
jgi:metallo-beta-lactamase family protein